MTSHQTQTWIDDALLDSYILEFLKQAQIFSQKANIPEFKEALALLHKVNDVQK